MKNFEIFSQAARPVGKPNHPVYWVLFSRTAVWVLYFVCAESWSFRVGIDLILFFWIPESMRKVLKSFEIFSQPARPVGKPNQPVHWVLFVGTAIWVLCFVYVSSWSFGVGIALRLFFWILNSMRKVLKNFEIFSQPFGLVGKPNQLVHWVMFA